MKKHHIKKAIENQGLTCLYTPGRNVYLKNSTLIRLHKHFNNEKSINNMIDKLLSFVTPRKGAFIWYLDINKYNEELSKRTN